MHRSIGHSFKVVALLGGIAFAFSADAANCRIKDGAKGKWSSPSIWLNGTIPTFSDSVALQNNANTLPIEIELDGDYTVANIGLGMDESTSAESRPPIRFTGAHTLTVTSGGYVILTGGCRVIFDGPVIDHLHGTVTLKKSSTVLELIGDSRLQLFNEGDSGTAGGFTFSEGPTLHVGGNAVLSVRSFDMGATKMIIDGGSFAIWGKEATVEAGGGVKFTKGVVTINQQSASSAHLFVPEGPEAVLISRGTSVNAYVTKAGIQGESYYVPGKLFVTNATASALAVSSAASSASDVTKIQNAGFWGRGDIYAQTLESNGQYLQNSTKFYSDFDVASLNLGYDLNGASTDSNRIPIWRTATLGFFGNFDYTHGSARSHVIEAVGDLTVDTLDCIDRTTVRNPYCAGLYANAGSTLTVAGGGTASFNISTVDTHQRWNKLTVDANTTLTFRPRTGTANGSTWPTIFTKDLTLGAGAHLPVTAGQTTVDVTGDLSISPTASIDVALPANPAAGAFYPVLDAQSGTDVSAVPVNFTPTGSWQVKRAEGLIYLHDGSADAPKTTANEWTGATDNTWTTGDNWNGGSQPAFGSDTVVVFSGTKNTNVNYDDTTARGNGNKIKTLKFLPGGPYHLTGNELHLVGAGGAGWNNSQVTIISQTALPVVIDNDIYHDVSSSQGFGPTAFTNSYIQLNGTVTCTDSFAPAGDIRIGGTLTCNRLYISQNRGMDPAKAEGGNYGRQTRLTVLPNARVTIKNMTLEQNGTGENPAIDVHENGVFAVTGGTKYWVTAAKLEHFVDGTFDCRIPLFSTKKLEFAGKGKAYLAGTLSSTANCNVGLGSGITVYPNSWSTATSDNPGKYIRLVVHTYATLGATNDWTYGVADGVDATTTAEERGLFLERAPSQVVFDTADPTTGAGHTITFNDPIVGYGRVEVKGTGTLLLNASCSASNGVDVTSGTLAWTVPQNFGRLTATSGSTLAFGAQGGDIAVADVKGDVDLTGVNIVPYGTAAKAALNAGYVTVLRTDGKITGVPAAGKYTFRVKDGALQAKRTNGMLVVIH